MDTVISCVDIITWQNTPTFYSNTRFLNWKAQKPKNDNLKIINIKKKCIDKI